VTRRLPSTEGLAHWRQGRLHERVLSAVRRHHPWPVVLVLLATAACSRGGSPSAKPPNSPTDAPPSLASTPTPPCTNEAARQVRDDKGEQPLLKTGEDGSYSWDLADMLGCADGLALVEWARMGGSFWNYYIVVADPGEWRIRADGSAWSGAPQSSAVFRPGYLAAVGLDPARVTKDLQRFASRPLVGDCVASSEATC